MAQVILSCSLSTPTSKTKAATSKGQNQGRFPPLIPKNTSMDPKGQSLMPSLLRDSTDGPHRLMNTSNLLLLSHMLLFQIRIMDQTSQKPSQTPQESFLEIQPTTLKCCSSKFQPQTPQRATLGLIISLLQKQRAQNLNASLWVGK